MFPKKKGQRLNNENSCRYQCNNRCTDKPGAIQGRCRTDILDIIAADCQEALSSEVNDYKDAVISCCASRNHMDYIVIRNIKDCEKSKIRAILPDEFMELVTGDNE